MSTFADMKSDPEVNAQASNFIRRKIREIVKNPQVAERLVPEIALGAKRICADTGYYETFNRPNVDLIDLRSERLVTVTADSIRTTARDVKVDTIVLALGFDAVTGAFSKIDIRGCAGRRLADAWRDGPSTYLGMTVAGFPNMFLVTGPGSPSILTNGVISGEQGANWIADCLSMLRDRNFKRIEATPSAQARWADHVDAVGAASLPAQRQFLCRRRQRSGKAPTHPPLRRQCIGLSRALCEYRRRRLSRLCPWVAIADLRRAAPIAPPVRKPRRAGATRAARRARPWPAACRACRSPITRPSSSTTITSALRTVDRRCAMTMVVHVACSLSSARRTACSLTASRCDVASSRISTGASLRKARDGDTLALPAREAGATLAHGRVETVRQRVYQLAQRRVIDRRA